MKILPAALPGLGFVENFHAVDNRGDFEKFFHAGIFAAAGIDDRFREAYVTISHRNVIRGMHFQKPPHALAKLVTVLSGRIIDVVFDLRRSSPSFGRFASFEMKADDHRSLYIPVGFAHGFCALEDDCRLLYLVTREYDFALDTGFRYDSFGFNWPVEGTPVLSERDLALPPLAELDVEFE